MNLEKYDMEILREMNIFTQIKVKEVTKENCRMRELIEGWEEKLLNDRERNDENLKNLK